jgi:pimeloyl-ACP methyl ester carboxylesterase
MMTDGVISARAAQSFVATLAASGHDVHVADSWPALGAAARGCRRLELDDLVEKDLPSWRVRRDIRHGQLVVLGHSLGGLVTTAALGTGKITAPRALLLPATAVWLVGPEGSIRRRALMAAYRGVTALFGRAPIGVVGAGTADESATYVGQLTGWARSARWTSLRGVDYLAALDAITSPVIPYVGAGDWMCTVDDARGFARRMPGAAALRVIGRKHGDALDPDHFQLFTRPELRPVWNELLAKLS